MNPSDTYKSVHLNELFDKPERLLIVGTSGSGKSEFATKLIRKYSHKFTHIIVSGTIKSDLEKYPETSCKLQICSEGLYNPFTHFEIADNISLQKRHVLLLYDDAMDEFLNSKIGADIFFKGRHWKLSVLVTLQNYYQKGSQSQTIRGQCTHLTLFKIRNLQQILTLARNLEGTKTRVDKFIEIYGEYVKKKPFGYITIFLDDPDETRYRTHLVGEEGKHDTVVKFGS